MEHPRLVLVLHRDVDHQPVQAQRLVQRPLPQQTPAVFRPDQETAELAVAADAAGLEGRVVGGEVGLEDGALVLGRAVQRAEQVFGVGGEFDELESTRNSKFTKLCTYTIFISPL